MTWLTIFRLLLAVADKVGDIIRARQLMDAGARAEIATQLARIVEGVEASKQVSDAIDKLSEKQVQDEVERDAR